MRVGMSMLTLVPGEMGGSETYARALCQALGARSGLELVAIIPSRAVGAIDGLPVSVVDGHPSGKLGGLAWAWLRRHRLSSYYNGLDVVHYPFTVPLPSTRAANVVTLHDVQHLDLPELFSLRTRAFRRVAYDRAARRADAVIVPSDFVRDRVLARLGLDPSCVHMVHHGVDHDTFKPVESGRENFLLYPAQTWPHKNHARLLEAFVLLRRSRPNLRLVLTGSGTQALTGAGVESLGTVPRSELVRLYQRAACLVFPSLYEGFGAPVLEAMACGTPVAASTAASLREVCADAAIYFDPTDPAAIAAAVEDALERQEDLASLGLERAASFTWEASARGHEAAYRTAVSG